MFWKKQFHKKTTGRSTAAAAAAAVPKWTLTEAYRQELHDKGAVYLGQKGYTVLKEHLSTEDLAEMKIELFKMPIVANGGPASNTAEKGFPVYRENERKIYLPRFYGIQRYGMPSRSELTAGDDLGSSCHFVGSLQPHQVEAAEVYLKHIGVVAAGDGASGGGAILELPCGYGKCLAKDTPILMWDGTIKKVQDVLPDDLLVGDDSTPRKVLTICRGREPLFRIRGKGGYSGDYVVNQSHILSLRNALDGRVHDIALTDYLEQSSQNNLLGYRAVVEWPERPITMSPASWFYSLQASREYGAIPMEYKRNSFSIRAELLAAIVQKWKMGTNGLVEIVNRSEAFVQDVQFLARSLGVVVSSNIQHITNVHGERFYKINLLGPWKNILPESEIIDTTVHNQYSFDVEPLGEGDYYGFEINGNRRFLLGDFTVTHNTVLAIHLIERIRKKTIILVHKEFLMNQWVDRIHQFMPNAKVGFLQGKRREMEDVDIVLGMIQSIFNKDFPVNTFASFGMTIIDEVHRIGSCEFSATLSKIVTPYMLGISATVDRKDQMTDILYMFIGPKIYSISRANDEPVCVQAIEYESRDPEFNEVEMLNNGKVNFSSMVSKLCSFAPRSDFIIRIIRTLFAEDPDKQMIVLCHNRCLLVYLYEQLASVAPSICNPTVGYYVGGMKQAQLEESESKQVVLATYAMAAEALDIKSLSTLLLVSPKTDIVQSVGRILRVKHERPLVIDLLDSHSCFRGQWVKRRQYYKRCNYKIIKTTCREYPQGWNVVYNPKEAHSAAAEERDEIYNIDSITF